MCSILLEPETLSAERRSREDSQKAIDQLMTYDRRLSEPFSREDLSKLFNPKEQIFRITSLRANYEMLTDEEKAIVEELGLTPKPGETISDMGDESKQQQSVEDRRREMKARLIDSPNFDGTWRRGDTWGLYHTGHIYIWLDNMNYCSTTKGFYYVRYQNSLLWMGTTAYAPPVLVMQKSKLRPDQVEYMERKCKETLAKTEKQTV